MFALVKYICSVKNLYRFPCFCLLAIYLIPSFIGIYYFSDTNSVLALAMLIVSVAMFLFTYRILSTQELQYVTKPPRETFPISFKFMMMSVFGAYLIFLAWVIATTPSLAFFDAFRGASATQLAIDREMQFHARHGIEAIIPYVNVLFVDFLCPLVILRSFVIKYRYRYLLFFGFIFTLFLNLEKALSLVILIPLLVMQLNVDVSQRKAKKYFYAVFGFIVVAILAAGVLSKVHTTSHVTFSKENRFGYFDETNTLGYALNRAIWIPYVTVYDTLGYFDTVLNGQHTLGASSSMLASVLGVPRINVEQGVFKYEWGQNATGTGASNAAYFVGAYVDFGWPGVILFSMLFALITRIIYSAKSEEVKYLYCSYVFNISTGSLISVLFSNYLILLIIFALFFRFQEDK